MTEPIFLDPRAERVLEKMVFLPLKTFELWDPLLLPTEKFFLFCGQKGCGMFKAIWKTIGEVFDFHLIDIESDTCEQEFEAIAEFKPFLFIKHIHMIARRPKLLKRFKYTASEKCHFIIAFSNASMPELGEHWYWDQFKTKVGYGIPDAEMRCKLMRFWFESWKVHAEKNKIGSVELTEDDYRWLGEECAAYCTPRDIKTFARRIFTYCIDQYPEKSIVITKQLLIDNRFVYEPFGIPEAYCITERNAQQEQSKFTPDMVNALTLKQVEALQNATKRRRTETSMEIQ